MTILSALSLVNPFGWFGGPYRAKLSGGGMPGQASLGVGEAAGQPVTVESALSLVTYWACVKIIAQTIGTLPLELYDLEKDGSRTPAVDNPLYDLLRHQPNAENTSVEFWEGVGACLAVWGNSYSEKAKTGTRVTSLEPLRPDWMTVFRASDGTPVYRYNDPTIGNGRTDYEAGDLMHVRGFGFGQLVGLSPLAYNRNTIGTALAVDEAAASVFRNGLRTSGWFKYKGGSGVLTKEQTADLKTRLIDPHAGSSRAGVAGILPGDFDWLASGMNPVDAEVLNNRKLNVEDICRGFGVPPVMVGHLGAGQTMWGTGVEHIVLGFMTTGLRPYLRRIEAAIGRDLIGRAGRKSLAAAFGLDELLQGDNKGMSEVDQSLANTGISTRNEIRRRRGLPPKPGGDTLTVQSALIPIDKLGEVAKLPKDKEVEPGADVGLGQPGGGPTGRAPFDGPEAKAFNPDQPRAANGRFGSGGPAQTIGDAFLTATGVTGKHRIHVKSKRVTKYKGHETVESFVAAHKKGRAAALREIAADHKAGRIELHGTPKKYDFSEYSDFGQADHVTMQEVERDLFKSSLTRPETKTEIAAMNEYSGSAYSRINTFLRTPNLKKKTGILKKAPGTEGTIKEIDSALANTRVTENILVYRGASGDYAKKLLAMKAGDTTIDAGFMSTSLKRSVSEGAFGGGDGVLMTLMLPKGNSGYIMNGRNVSSYPGEHEMLLPRNTKLRIVKIEGREILAEVL